MRTDTCRLRWCKIAPIALAFVLTLATCSPLAAQSWTSTATKGIGNLLSNASSLGLMPASTPVHVSVALQLNNKQALQQYIQVINTPGKCSFR